MCDVNIKNSKGLLYVHVVTSNPWIMHENNRAVYSNSVSKYFLKQIL